MSFPQVEVVEVGVIVSSLDVSPFNGASKVRVIICKALCHYSLSKDVTVLIIKVIISASPKVGVDFVKRINKIILMMWRVVFLILLRSGGTKSSPLLCLGAFSVNGVTISIHSLLSAFVDNLVVYAHNTVGHVAVQGALHKALDCF